MPEILLIYWSSFESTLHISLSMCVWAAQPKLDKKLILLIKFWTDLSVPPALLRNILSEI